MSPIMVTVLGWFLSPIIRFLLPKIFVCPGLDPSNKLLELEIHIIPELKKTMQTVDQERMMQRGKRVKTDLDALDKMAAMLRHALEDAEDIFDDAQHKIVLRCWHRLFRAFATCRSSSCVQTASAWIMQWVRKIMSWSRHKIVLSCCHRLYGAFSVCIALCKCCCVWISRVVRTKSARLLQWVRDISLSLFLLCRSEESVAVNVSAAVVSDKPVQVIMVTVLGWFLSPIITLVLPKILVCLGFDASDKLQDLEIHIIPELKKTMQSVDQERMMQRGKRVKTDLDALDKMAAMLRHALEDAEDIFDDAQHKIVLRCWHRLFRAFATCRSSSCVQTASAWIMQWVRKIMSWSRHKIVLSCCHRLYGAFSVCIALCKCCCVWISRVVRTKSARLLQWVRDISLSLFLLCRSEESVAVNVSAAVVSDKPVQVIMVTVLGWFLSPIITLVLPKILVCLGFDASDKLQDLEIHIIPELKKTMQSVDQERMMQRGKRVKTDLDALDKMAAMLRHALEDAEDIFDDAQHKIVLRCWHRLFRAFATCRSSSCVQTASTWIMQWVRKIMSWSRHKIVLSCCHRLYGAFSVCIALCKCCCVWISRVVRTKSARLLQWVRDISLSLFLLCRSEESVAVNVSAAVVSDKPVQVIMVTVLGWFLSPIITLVLPKILVCLGFDASDKLQDLEIHIIPELKKTMQSVDQERMMQRGKRVKTDLDALDKMAAMLRHALEDAEDIFDDAQHKIVLRCWHRLFRAFATCRSSSCVQTASAWIMQWVRKIMSWSRHKIVLSCCHRLYGAFSVCIALCKCCCVWISRVVRTKSARLLQWVRDISLSLFLLCRSEESVAVNVSAAVVLDKPVQVIMVTVLGWFLSPIITLVLPKILVCLGFDASDKLQDLEIHIIPELKKTMQSVDQERMMQRGKRVKTDLDALDKMAAMLRHALEDAEDIFDDAQHKIVLRCWHRLFRAFATCRSSSCVQTASAWIMQWVRKIMSWSRHKIVLSCCHRLYGAFSVCIALCKCCCVWISRVVRTKSARLLQWVRDISLSLFLLCRSEESVAVNVSAAVVSDKPVQVIMVTVLGWFLSPIITLVLPKILVCLGFDASDKLQDLEIHIIPELKKTMQSVDQERMMQRGKRVKTDLDALDKMAAMLRHALEDAEDIFDDAQHKIVLRCWHRLFRAFATCRSSSCVQTASAWIMQWVRKIMSWSRHKIVLSCCHRLYGAFSVCIALCKCCCVWISRVVRTKSARLLQWVRDISLSLFLLCRSEESVAVNVSAAVVSNKPVQVIMVTVLGWFLSPIITLVLPKILVCLGFDASDKLQDLEIHIIPELKKTMQSVDQERMMQRGKRVKTDLDALDKMAAMLRHALEDAEDIFDDAQHKIVLRCWHRLFRAFATCRSSSCVQTASAWIMQWVWKIMSWSRHKIVLSCCHRLYGAFSVCIALCKCCCVWISRVVRTKSARLLQWVRDISLSLFLLCRSEESVAVNVSAAIINRF